MNGRSERNPIKRLHTEKPRRGVFDLEDLRPLGITAQTASYYAKTGWLVRIGHGVYAFPGEEPTLASMVALLQDRIPGLRIGGKSALAMHGVRHTLGELPRVVLWGEAGHRLPRWFTERQPTRYVSRQLFDWPDADLAERTVGTPPGVTAGLRVSTPERAALEMLYDVGTHEHYEDARDVFDGLRHLRQEVVGQLLSSCRSVKAVRLFLTWARETGVVSVEDLRARHDLRVGSDRRWIQRLKDGTLLTLHPYG